MEDADGLRRAVERIIAGCRARRLPPMRAMAGQLHAPLRRVMAVLSRLRQEGRIAYGHGKPLVVAGREAPPRSPRRPSAAERMRSLLRDGIASGRYRQGQPLPKVASLTSGQGVSTKTVAAAVRRLEAERLIHRKGKAWIVGAAPGPRPPHMRRDTILLLHYGPGSWSGILKSERTEGFGRAFPQCELVVVNAPEPSMAERRDSHATLARALGASRFEDMRALRARLSAGGSGGPKLGGLTPAQRALADLAPYLAPLLLPRRVTAILAMNDALAHDYYIWCRYAGIGVPGDLSLLSFDANERALYPWPISSVDLGSRYLGFRAYHRMVGDGRDGRRGGEIPAVCALNHYASIGAAAPGMW